MAENSVLDQSILLATPDKSVCKQLATVLGRAGFGLVVTHNGEEAYRLAMETKEIRVMVLDTNLPGLNGYEVTSRIRKEGNPGIVIILLAWFSIHSLEMALAVECNEYIAKPLVANELFEIILKWLKASAPESKNI